MRQALLLIKVALILASFVSFNGTQAGSSGQHDLVAQANDLAFGSSPSNGDDKKAIRLVTLLTVFPLFIESPTFRQTFAISTAKATLPFARAPPVNPRF